MKYIAAVRKMDAERAMREIPALSAKLRETMGDAVHVVTSVDPNARGVGRMLLRWSYFLRTGEQIPENDVVTRWSGFMQSQVAHEVMNFEPDVDAYLSEPNGTQIGRYDGNREQLLSHLNATGSRTEGLIVVPDYDVYCDITRAFKDQAFRGSGRHKVPSLDEATATVFDMNQKRIQYL